MLDNNENEKQSEFPSLKDSNDDITTITNENPDNIEGVNEPSEIRDDENKALQIEQIKSHHLRYKTNKHFGVKFKKERASKNRQTKKSRKINRRK